MNIEKNNTFKSGDIVETEKGEYDIEYIPRGTRIVLTKKNGKTMWYGEGDIHGRKRNLLVFTSNLRIFKKHMENNSKK
ncbi:MAG: hypothetical protein KBC41_02660 [Candidatus Pacebacteria bacterium]|nr:hypothetical protein [Candidatus Paceibacterota bacterium]